MLTLSDFKCEYQAAPLGLDERLPRFSWILNSDENGVKQTAYRLSVRCKNKTVWRVKRTSARSVLVQYAGQQLLPRTRYTASVTVWDNKGNRASASLIFETGIFAAFTADFIAPPQYSLSQCPVLQKQFDASAVKSARLYITALGLYEAQINGKRVGNFYLTPGNTDYKHHLQYQTYDVTALIKQHNTLDVTLASGWYCGIAGCVNKKEIYGTCPAMLCELYLTHKDGTETVIKSDTTWQYGYGMTLQSEREKGEQTDTGKPLTLKGNAVKAEYDKSRIIAQEGPCVRIMEQIPAVSVITTPSGKQVLDFGQNLSGFVRFTCRRKAGTVVTLKHCEVLDNNGEIYTTNLRTADCTDTYILNGKKQTLCPRFTFRGFRYAQVEGLGKLDKADFTACVLYSDMEQTGSFTCSDENVNRLTKNILWSQKDNFTDIPTDCPQRDERLGWTGDAQVFCSTAAYNMDVAAFFTRWLRVLADEQTEQYGVPQTVPDVFGNTPGTAAWGDAATVIPYTMYRVYGDERLLARQYPSMKSWVEYISRRLTDGVWKDDFQFGDWLGMDREGSSRFGATDGGLVATAFYIYSLSLTAKAARVLGKKDDIRRFNGLRSAAVKAFYKEYVTPSGRLVSQTQTAYVLALWFDILQQKDIKKAEESLRKNLLAHDMHIVTGFAGTPYICKVLTKHGMHALAAQLLLQKEYPSWLYPVLKGATTIWERWNGIKPDGSFEDASMNSFNHYAYGSVGDWLYADVAGLNTLEPGYKTALLAPHLTDGLDSAEASLKTVYGRLYCGWKRTQNGVAVTAEVPCNTTAILHLPLSNKEITLESGKYIFEDTL